MVKPEITTQEIKDYLAKAVGREVDLTTIRKDFQILPEAKSWDAIRNIMFQLAEQKIVKPSGKRDGVYRVIPPVVPVRVYGVERERRPPYDFRFPQDFDTGMEFPFAEHVVIREGDSILIAGQSNWGKTALALNICGENIDSLPVLMGNEFTKDNEPTPRFLNRLDAMNWVSWTNGNGQDKFTLLPVYSDFAEHVLKNRLNIIDWINIDTGEYYMIGSIMESIKRNVGRGIAVIVIQKGEGESGRGGQFTKDFADLELLIDKHTDYESRITVGKVKETTKAITGKSYAFMIEKGVKLLNIREVVKCHTCHGFKFIKGKGACETCGAVGFIDK